MTWWVENNSQKVRFRGEVSNRDDLKKVIATLSAQLPLLERLAKDEASHGSQSHD